jgi:hypothetical protein
VLALCLLLPPWESGTGAVDYSRDHNLGGPFTQSQDSPLEASPTFGRI